MAAPGKAHKPGLAAVPAAVLKYVRNAHVRPFSLIASASDAVMSEKFAPIAPALPTTTSLLRRVGLDDQLGVLAFAGSGPPVETEYSRELQRRMEAGLRRVAASR